MPNLTIRNMDPDILARFNRAAGARQMTQREYLAALVRLHDMTRQLVAGTWPDTLQDILEGLELDNVTA